VKPIVLTSHAREQSQDRGASASEIEEAIRQGQWASAARGRSESQLDFTFNSEWRKHYYRTKRVRAIFVEEPDAIVVITVYTYYF
jgi:hypothetical protein